LFASTLTNSNESFTEGLGMSQFSRTFMVTLLTASLFASGIAEAKRVGGSRSSGMQRSQTTRPAAPPPQRNIAPAQQPAAPQPQRSGMGSILGGVAAGALGGYLLGNLLNSNHASGTSESSGGGFPWGLLLLLGAGGYFAMRMMRKRKEAASPAFAGMANSMPQQDNNPAQDRVFRMGDQAASAAPVSTAITRLPDGTETAAFLRQARGSFMHMQTLHSPEQVNEMRKYLTPELFNELSKDISGNEEPAEFPELNAELVDCATEDGRMISSVRFYGKVSESLHAAPEAFQEIWHFVRPINGDPRWMVAGIQQL
jgi:MYXO-CTERM domain-containing protein